MKLKKSFKNNTNLDSPGLMMNSRVKKIFLLIGLFFCVSKVFAVKKTHKSKKGLIKKFSLFNQKIFAFPKINLEKAKLNSWFIKNKIYAISGISAISGLLIGLFLSKIKSSQGEVRFFKKTTNQETQIGVDTKSEESQTGNDSYDTEKYSLIMNATTFDEFFAELNPQDSLSIKAKIKDFSVDLDALKMIVRRSFDSNTMTIDKEKLERELFNIAVKIESIKRLIKDNSDSLSKEILVYPFFREVKDHIDSTYSTGNFKTNYIDFIDRCSRIVLTTELKPSEKNNLSEQAQKRLPTERALREVFAQSVVYKSDESSAIFSAIVDMSKFKEEIIK